MNEDGSVEKAPQGEAVFYMEHENDGGDTIWAVYPCGTCQFLSESNAGEWKWYNGAATYAARMSAEKI